MRRLLVAFLLTAVWMSAQEKKEEPKPQPYIQKLIMLKYADPQNVYDLLRVFGANLIPNRELHAIGVNAPPATVQAVEEAIAKLDVPAAAPKNINLIMQLVLGSDTDGASSAIPKDLEPVVTQLRGVFPFKSYRLLDVLALRTRTGQQAGTDSSGGTLQLPSASKTVFSSFSIGSSSIAADGVTIRLDHMRCSSKIPQDMGNAQFSYQDLSMNTDVDIKEGQKVVIGRHGISRDQALFLVLTAQTVQ